MWDYFFNNEYLYFLGIIIITLVIVMVLRYLIELFYSKTRIHQEQSYISLIDVIKKPLYYYIFITGAFIAVKKLSFLNTYYVWVERIFFVVFSITLAILVSRTLIFLSNKWFRLHKYKKSPNIVSIIITSVTYLLVLLMILTYLKIELTPLIATLGISGLAIGLALQNTLSNFFADLNIISDKPLSVGDYIILPDTTLEGFVDDIGWRSTRIRMLSNNLIIIPNSKLAETVIINTSLPDNQMSILVEVGVDYGSDLEKVEKVTIEVAKQIQAHVSGAVKSFEPVIRFHTFADSNINFTVILRCEKFVDKFIVKHEFMKALKKRYDAEGIEISWPIRKIYKRK